MFSLKPSTGCCELYDGNSCLPSICFEIERFPVLTHLGEEMLARKEELAVVVAEDGMVIEI